MILAIWERPSNVDKPIASAFLLIATDWSWLFLPKSDDYKIVLFPGLLISINPIL